MLLRCLATMMPGSILAFALLALAPPAQAAFPGVNGKIAFGHIALGGLPHSSFPIDYTIFSMNPDGTHQRNLTDDEPYELHPAWSPDGQKIAFSKVIDSDNYEIYVMNADGTAQTNLTHDGGADFEPAWSPDGTKIVFTSVRDRDGDNELYVMNADGSKQTRLTRNDTADSDPAWSPDGQRIAFTSGRDGNPEIYVTNSDGSSPRNLTNHPAYDAQPDWSPDASKIAFYSGRCCPDGIYTMNADRSDPNNLTGLGRRGIEPVWSPDGTKLAFSAGSGHTTDIFTINADGSGTVNVSRNPRGHDYDPEWQPLNGPPSCSGVTAAPSVLWPPNRKFKRVILGGGPGRATLRITSVRQDEPLARGASPDARSGPAPGEVFLRAERDAKGDGRVYRIGFTAAGGAGSCSGTARVSVPRRKQVPAADSAPPSYDSLGR